MFFPKKKKKVKRYFFSPKEDITAYEVALLLPKMIYNYPHEKFDELISKLPENCKRHIGEYEIEV